MGLVMELWKPACNVNRNGTSRQAVRLKVEKDMLVSDEAVLAVKYL